jgi:hypothetical protein
MIPSSSASIFPSIATATTTTKKINDEKQVVVNHSSTTVATTATKKRKINGEKQMSNNDNSSAPVELEFQQSIPWIDYLTPENVVSQVPVHPFKPNELIQKDWAIGVFGKRRTGKSFFLDWLFYHLAKQRAFNFGLVFTNTKVNGFWSKRVPECFIHEGYNEQVLAEFILTLKKFTRDAKQHPELYENYNLGWFVIFDDVLESADEMARSPSFTTLLTQGRHFGNPNKTGDQMEGKFIAVTSQVIKGLGLKFRNNLDLIVTFVQKNGTQREAFIKELMPEMNYKTGGVFLDHWTRLPENSLKTNAESLAHRFLAINNSKNLHIKETFFGGIAQKVPAYVLGSTEFWESSANNNNQDDLNINVF